MNDMQTIWRLSVPRLFDVPDASLDDAGVDGSGNLLIADGSNGRIYRLGPDREADVLPGMRSASLGIAVAPDSSYCLSDADREIVARYNPGGEYLGEFPVPGLIAVCPGLFALYEADGALHVGLYDEFGFMTDSFPAPLPSGRLDLAIVGMESDSMGNVYLSYGMPPYQIWKVTADGFEAWSQRMDYPDDAILIADIAVDQSSQTLWALLACRKSGRQLLDAFSLDGEFLGTHAIPQSEPLYGLMCSAGNSDLFLLDTSTGPSSGEVLRIALAGE